MREFFLNSGIYFEENVPLKKLTTFGTGGPARYVVQPKDEREISAVLTYLKQNDVPYFCLGGGSNVLASDDGFSGVVIVVGRFMSQIFLKTACLLRRREPRHVRWRISPASTDFRVRSFLRESPRVWAERRI